MPYNCLIFCHLLLQTSIFPSIRVFSNESVLCIRWPNYWSFSFCLSTSNEYSGLISFRIDWFDLLAVQETLKSLLQHHSLKASILWLSAFFIVQLSHPYMTTEKTIALTRRTFVGKVISLLFNMLSRLVIAFLSFFLSFFHSFSFKEHESFNFMAAVTICGDFGAPQNKVSHCFHCFPIYLPWSDGTGCHDLSFLNVELKARFFTLLFHFHQESSSLLSAIRMFSAIRVVSSTYLRLLIFLPAILIPDHALYSPSFHMMYSAYNLNRQGENIQPWHTPFPIWNQSIVPCPVLTVASWPAYRFLRKQVRWSGIPISLRIFHSLL